jgi:hypothetical protein
LTCPRLPQAAPRTAVRRRGRPFLQALAWRAAALAALLACATAAPAAELSELDALLAAGTPRLALTVIDNEQPAPGNDRDGWLAWEARRLALLYELREWAALEQRIASHPGALPPDFTDRSRTLLAAAALARDDGAGARTHLSELIWRGDDAAAPNLPRWRELVIRSYLADGLNEDAHLAMVRYRQDHGHDDPALRELAVRILLLSGRPAAALTALGDADDPTADALRLLALLRSGQAPAATIADAAEQQAQAMQRDGADLAATRYWSVAAAASAAAEQPAARVARLEAGLPARDLPPSEALFALTPQQLWDAYRSHGEALGNRAQLLVGQDAAWFELATDRTDAAPLEARALFATLARIGHDPDLRQASHVAFAGMLAAMPRGDLLLNRLYLDGDPGLAVDTLPVELRRQLADAALASDDPVAAARLFATLDGPPPGMDPFAWRLQRARVLVRAGEAQRGGAELLRLVTAQPQRAASELAALLPVVRALQQAGAHAQAAALLEPLLPLPPSEPELLRALQLAYADSQRALQRPASAARFYLRAAHLPGLEASDDRGREARHRAVQALRDAGFSADARRLLQGLVAETEGAERAELERELEQLPERPESL